MYLLFAFSESISKLTNAVLIHFMFYLMWVIVLREFMKPVCCVNAGGDW